MKGQMALESLMTYGWGILVVLAAIATLAYFGVMSQDKNVADTCILPPAWHCEDVVIKEDGVDLSIRNGGLDATINSVTIDGCPTIDVGLFMESGRNVIINVPCVVGGRGTMALKNFDLNYTVAMSSFEKITRGEIRGTII